MGKKPRWDKKVYICPKCGGFMARTEDGLECHHCEWGMKKKDEKSYSAPRT